MIINYRLVFKLKNLRTAGSKGKYLVVCSIIYIMLNRNYGDFEVLHFDY